MIAPTRLVLSLFVVEVSNSQRSVDVEAVPYLGSAAAGGSERGGLQD
jgi:hypothetical protein